MGTDILGGDRLTQNTMDSEKEEDKKNLYGQVGGWVDDSFRK